MKALYDHIYEYSCRIPVISTHSHHMQGKDFQGFDLDTLLGHSYVNWCGVAFDRSKESRRAFLEKVRYNSYYVWLHKAIQDIYSITEPLTAENWDCISLNIREAHLQKEHHMDLLRNKCGYQKVVLDTYWEPGSHNGSPELFTPTYRINMFLYGYSLDAADHNGNNPLALYNGGKFIGDIDEYVSFMEDMIRRKKKDGCIALKSAIAYERGLDFTETSRDRAQRALSASKENLDAQGIKDFQDYIFFQICSTAARLGLPLQCHTGLGQMRRTNAMEMQEVIAKNPETSFVLFHCSYPWMDDVNGLLHNYANVYPDMCWLPLISTSAAQRMLEELIEVGTADKVCWGCDTWSSEESYGALLAIRYVLAKVLSGKVHEGYLSLEDAEGIVERVLYRNAQRLYSL